MPPRNSPAKLDTSLRSRDVPAGPVQTRLPGELLAGEHFWRDHQRWLEQRGYELRPRYRPDWVPSWRGTKKHWDQCEDGQPPSPSHILDATRIRDRLPVTLKKVSHRSNPEEADIGTFFASEPHRSRPQNHCVPIFEVLQVPDVEDTGIIVMARLRKLSDPPFIVVGEVVDFCSQILEGLQCMHTLQIAHRDCNRNNVMMDASRLYPDSYHPVVTNKSLDFKSRARYLTRSQVKPTYYFTDFGISRRYERRPALDTPVIGGDKSVPEHRSSSPCDPFATDIYGVGNLIRTEFLEPYRNLGFLKPLVDKMVHPDPTRRPTIEIAIASFNSICTGFTHSQLHSRLVGRKELFLVTVFRNMMHKKPKDTGAKPRVANDSSNASAGPATSASSRISAAPAAAQSAATVRHRNK